MNEKAIYSIGHGTRRLEDFLSLLQQYEIEYLIDVRSYPHSKFNPHFNQKELKEYLDKHGITYAFWGDALGGRPKDSSCYDDEGKVDYKKLQHKELYKTGIERLRNAYLKGYRVVIMCSESKPCECHRSKLIGMSLLDENGNGQKIFLQHIDEKGKLKDQAAVMNELNGGKSSQDLFDLHTTSRKSYV